MSYAHAFASGARNGRVEVASRPLGAVTRVAALEGEDAPRFVLARGGRILVDYGYAVIRVGRDGALETEPRGWLEERWDCRFDMVGPERATLIAYHILGNYVFCVYQHEANIFAREELVARALAIDPPPEGYYGWEARYRGMGVGAVAPDGTVVAAIADRVLVLAPEGAREVALEQDGLTPPVVLADRRLGDRAVTELSILSARPDPRGADATAWCTVEAVDHNASRITAFDGQASEFWSTEVPFRVTEPPVDGGDGRIVAAGLGLASIAGGSVRWAEPSAVRQRVTASSDGHLYVVAGSDLRILTREGEPIATFSVDAEAPISTPAALDADGTVWLATPDALHHIT